MKGWIRLHRKLLENPVVMKDSDYLAVWVYLLLNASHGDCDVLFGNNRVKLQMGQLMPTSRKKIAADLHISESKVERILKSFENEHQIEQQTNSRNRLISITNWDKYQKSEQVIEQQPNSKWTASGQQVDTINNGNNGNNGNNEDNDNKKNKEFLDDLIEQNFELLWKLYPRKEGKSSVSKKTKKEIYKVGYDKMTKCIELFIADMKEQNRDLQYYPQGSTFFNTKYKDYLEKLEEKEKRESEILEKQSEEDIEEFDDDDGWEKLYDENTTFDWGNF